MNKLTVIIPKWVIDYSHTGNDIKEHMNEESVWELLIIKAKLEYLEGMINFDIIDTEPKYNNTEDDYSEWADIWLR